MTKQEIKCVMSFSVYKHFDNVLNAVENDGLEGLNNDEVRKALTEMIPAAIPKMPDTTPRPQ